MSNSLRKVGEWRHETVAPDKPPQGPGLPAHRQPILGPRAVPPDPKSFPSTRNMPPTSELNPRLPLGPSVSSGIDTRLGLPRAPTSQFSELLQATSASRPRPPPKPPPVGRHGHCSQGSPPGWGWGWGSTRARHFIRTQHRVGAQPAHLPQGAPLIPAFLSMAPLWYRFPIPSDSFLSL